MCPLVLRVFPRTRCYGRLCSTSVSHRRWRNPTAGVPKGFFPRCVSATDESDGTAGTCESGVGAGTAIGL